MLTAFARAFRTPDLRRKILFSMGIMALFRLGSVIPTPGVSYEAVQDCIDNNADTGLYSLINLFSGGALLQLSIFALGHHAVHHGEHHRAAADGGDPAVRGPQEGGPVRHREAHAVHALPHHRPGGPAVHRPDRAGPPARPAVPGLPERHHLHRHRHLRHRGHGHHDDRRHRRHHVARRAHHRPRHRQRHVAADLHLDRGRLPDLAVADQAAARLDRCSWWSSPPAWSSSPWWSSSSRRSAASRCSTRSG